MSETRDRVAVTYPGQTKLVPWVKSGDRYAVQGRPQPCNLSRGDRYAVIRIPLDALGRL